MAFRSLTEGFILMRNNAMQNRHIFAEPVRSSVCILWVFIELISVMNELRTVLLGCHETLHRAHHTEIHAWVLTGNVEYVQWDELTKGRNLQLTAVYVN